MKKLWVLLVIPLLCFGFFNWFSSEPVVTGKQANPIKVYPGQSLNIMVSFEDKYGIEKATAYFQHEKGEDKVDMILSAGYDTKGTYSANWIVRDTLDQVWYGTRVVLVNKKGKKTETFVRWQDPTQSHSLSQIKPGHTNVDSVVENTDGSQFNFTYNGTDLAKNYTILGSTYYHMYPFMNIKTHNSSGLFVNSSYDVNTLYQYAIKGFGKFIGVVGETDFGYGVQGKTTSSSSGSIGVYGHASSSSGSTKAVYGLSESSSGIGIYGEASSSSGSTIGVRGESNSPNGWGVVAEGADYNYNSLYNVTQINSETRGQALLAKGDENITGLTNDNCVIWNYSFTKSNHTIPVPESCIDSTCDIILSDIGKQESSDTIDTIRQLKLVNYFQSSLDNRVVYMSSFYSTSESLFTYYSSNPDARNGINQNLLITQTGTWGGSIYNDDYCFLWIDRSASGETDANNWTLEITNNGCAIYICN